MNLDVTDWIESLFNRLLADDLVHKEALLKYTGKVLVLDLINTRASYAISITEYGINLSPEIPETVDVIIRATPLALISYMRAVKRSEPLVSGIMEITGDIALAQGVLSIIRDLKIDWEEYLSYWTGDILAYKASSLVDDSRKAFRYANKSLRNDLSEYLRYESAHLISESDMQEFNRDVENLRDDVDRLKARMERIQKTIEEQG